MKIKLVLIITIMLCSLSISAQQLPNTTLETQNRGKLNITDLLDGETPLIISFWSTTCSPCIQELDAIYNVIEEWNKEAKFKVVAVSTDDSRSISKAKAMASSRGWTDNFVMLYDSNGAFKRALSVSITPQVFIFDKGGKQVYSHTGYIPGSEEEYIEKILELK